MTSTKIRAIACAAVGIGLVAGCQATGEKSPAVLMKADAAAMAEVKSVLAKSMGKSRIELGAGDLTKGSVITVLPPRLGPMEDRSMAVPTQFELMMDGQICYLVRQDTGEALRLTDVSCRALDKEQ